MYLVQNKGDIVAAQSVPCYIRVPLWEDLRMTELINNMPAPRILKTHLPFQLLPQAGQVPNKKVYILRNPKDTAVSYYYFYKSLTELNNYTGSWAEFLEMFMTGYVVHGRWHVQVLSWWQQRHSPHVLLITYEQLKREPYRVIRDIAAFLHNSNDALDTETIQRIVDHTQFKAMKDNPSTNFSGIESLRLPFMRKGEIGDWKNHFTVAQSKAFDDMIRDTVTDPELLKFIQQET